jgi:hypothetical protein
VCFEMLNHVSWARLFTWPLAKERINASSDAEHSNVLKLQHGCLLLFFELPLRLSVWDSLKFPCFLIEIMLPPGCRSVYALLGFTEERRLVFS